MGKLNIDEINKHLTHNISKEKARIEGDNVILSQYCFDCDKEYDIEEKENKWNLDKTILCPICGKDAVTSTKYFQDDTLKVRKKQYIHCFNCDYTKEDFIDECN